MLVGTIENYKDDKEAIEAFLTNHVNSSQLQELRKASSLIEAPNVDNKPKEEKLQKLFADISDYSLAMNSASN